MIRSFNYHSDSDLLLKNCMKEFNEHEYRKVMREEAPMRYPIGTSSNKESKMNTFSPKAPPLNYDNRNKESYRNIAAKAKKQTIQ